MAKNKIYKKNQHLESGLSTFKSHKSRPVISDRLKIYDSIKRQQNAIVEAMHKNNSKKISKYTTELIEFSRSHSVKSSGTTIACRSLLNLAQRAHDLGKIDLQFELIEKALNLDPHNVDSKIQYADALNRVKRFEEALHAYEQIIAENTFNVVAKVGRADTLHRLGRIEDALQAYEQTIAEHPSDIVPKIGRADTLRSLERLEDALHAYESVIAEYPFAIPAENGRAETIRTLLANAGQPPKLLVQVVDTISQELVAYIKTHPYELYNIRPRQFEELIAEILASFGWDVQLTPATKDGGYDLFAVSKDISGLQTHWIIECKKYSLERKVGVDIVRALYGVMMDLKVANALLATTSHFTKGVNDFKASRYNLELVDYEGILEWINEYQPNPNGRLYAKNDNLILPGKV